MIASNAALPHRHARRLLHRGGRGVRRRAGAGPDGGAPDRRRCAPSPGTAAGGCGARRRPRAGIRRSRARRRRRSHARDGSARGRRGRGRRRRARSRSAAWVTGAHGRGHRGRGRAPAGAGTVGMPTGGVRTDEPGLVRLAPRRSTVGTRKRVPHAVPVLPIVGGSWRAASHSMRRQPEKDIITFGERRRVGCRRSPVGPARHPKMPGD